MKSILFVISVLMGVFVFVVATGSYPVVLVDGSPIFSKTWKKAEDAAKNFANTQAKSTGNSTVNFFSRENSELLVEVKRDTLTFLIEDEIIKRRGEEVTDGLGILSRELVSDALRKSGDQARAAKLVYGLNLDDFYDLVLLPQARQDVLKEALLEKNQDFDSWLKSAKKETRVTLLFIPFKWDGEFVR